jgi:hypothetical protein
VAAVAGSAAFQWTSVLKPPPGDYEVRAAVATEDGTRAASVIGYLDVPDVRKTGLVLSGVVVKSAGRPTLQRVLPPASPCRAARGSAYGAMRLWGHVNSRPLASGRRPDKRWAPDSACACGPRLAVRWRSPVSPARRLDGRDVDLLHRIIASKPPLASAPPAACPMRRERLSRLDVAGCRADERSAEARGSCPKNVHRFRTAHSGRPGRPLPTG